MNIRIETIPNKMQRYPTVGDWLFEEDGTLVIKVSDTGDWRYDSLIAVHELVEVILCKDRGISQEAVDKFDIDHLWDDEPGDHPDSPYQNEHNLATGIERILCASLGIKWDDYAETLEKIDSTYE